MNVETLNGKQTEVLIYLCLMTIIFSFQEYSKLFNKNYKQNNTNLFKNSDIKRFYKTIPNYPKQPELNCEKTTNVFIYIIYKLNIFI